jgi:hypothetical protein
LGCFNKAFNELNETKYLDFTYYTELRINNNVLKSDLPLKFCLSNHVKFNPSIQAYGS